MEEDQRLTALAATLPSSVPFVGPEAQERRLGRPFAARLGANESAFGPSPLAIEAVKMAASEAWMYGDPESHDLREALAKKHEIPADCIIIDAGIDTLLGLVVRLMIAPGDAVVTSAGAYPTFNYHVAGFGGQVHAVPYRNDHEDPDALIAKALETNAKLIYLANPDNPMGSHHAAPTIDRMIAAVPPAALLVLDEAYVDLAPDGTAPAIDPDDRRVLRMRTFSKAYGLAGARVGYAIGHPDVIRAFHKVRNHFGMSRISQAAALASLADPDWLAHIRREVETARASLGQIARDNGLVALPSATNFVTIDCGADGDFARKVLKNLIDMGVFVRMPFVAPQDRCIRVSCAPPQDCAAFAAALPQALKLARK